MHPDLVIVGAGPAGLAAAIAAAQTGARVLLIEQLDRPSMKLLATGGGRCNFTNTASSETFMAAFGRHGRFMQPALAALDATQLRRRLDALRVPSHSPNGFHIYPQSNSAAPVQQALERECGRLRVELRCGAIASRLLIEDGTLRGLALADGQAIHTQRVIIATGGQSYRRLGGTGGGYTLARQAGHTIVTPVPALVPLVTKENWPARAAGASLDPASVRIDARGPRKEGVRGALLFTHTGLSGPLILDISGDVSVLLRQQTEVILRLNLAPNTPPAEWPARIAGWQQTAGAKTVFNLLDQFFPKSVADLLCHAAELPPRLSAAQFTAAQQARLRAAITDLKLTVTGTAGWDQAMVTRGGVALKDVDPKTLESQLLPGLFFAGEVLDLDGPCGGYNLQWAFSSGWLAGSRAARP